MRDNKDSENVLIVLHSSDTTFILFSFPWKYSYDRDSLCVPGLTGMLSWDGTTTGAAAGSWVSSGQSAVKWTLTVSDLGGGSCEQGSEGRLCPFGVSLPERMGILRRGRIVELL